VVRHSRFRWRRLSDCLWQSLEYRSGWNGRCRSTEGAALGVPLGSASRSEYFREWTLASGPAMASRSALESESALELELELALALALASESASVLE
jgi:hypothetical protein